MTNFLVTNLKVGKLARRRQNRRLRIPHKAAHLVGDQGYQAMAAALSCALDGTPIPNELKTFEPELYYPATLYLLSMSLVGEKYPKCL